MTNATLAGHRDKQGSELEVCQGMEGSRFFRQVGLYSRMGST